LWAWLKGVAAGVAADCGKGGGEAVGAFALEVWMAFGWMAFGWRDMAGWH